MKPDIVFLLAAIALTACKQQEAPLPEQVRAVKTMQVTAVESGTTRTLAGIVNSSEKSTLSFRVGGRISEVLVNNGDLVTKGQVLARLEDTEYRLQVHSAQAHLDGARSTLAEMASTLQRQQKLKENNFVAQAAVEHALAAHQAALSSVKVAETALKNAQQDLESTQMTAPFNGTITARQVEPFMEIQAGLIALELQNERALEVEVLMPETLIHALQLGQAVAVDFPTLESAQLMGTITEIGAKAERGNAYVVRVKLADHREDILTGMTAQLAFTFNKDSTDSRFLIPLSALDMRLPPKASAMHPDKGILYKIQEGRAQAVEVHIHAVRGNQLEISDSLEEGDQVIIAGAPFLSDGQAVKIWQPTYKTAANINQ
jgi:RND family efflux transporter MFP subunit